MGTYKALLSEDGALTNGKWGKSIRVGASTPTLRAIDTHPLRAGENLRMGSYRVDEQRNSIGKYRKSGTP